MSGAVLKILIADDDEGDRKQIKRAIQQAGLQCECTETSSTEQALEICEQSEFDCAIFDYRLPGQDGLAGISALHERFPNLPIIMSTGHGDELIAADAMKRGASDYIPKANVNALSMQRIIGNVIEKAALHRKVRQQQEELEIFARVLVHDLRAPAAAIQTFSTRIAERLASGEPEKALEYANWVIQTAERMNLLIETLHRYTTADAKITFEPVDMNPVFEAALANLQDQIQEAGARVTAANLPTVLGNAPQLIQLLQNLIGNGIKFCDDSAPCIQVAASGIEGGGWLFSVTDNGIGIPEAHCKRIFEPFVRLTGRNKRKGSGLGLATCKKIIDRHLGSIWCQSKPGSGTTFFFTLSAANLRADENDRPALSANTSESLCPDPEAENSGAFMPLEFPASQ
jgi:signal transduction histidine kinase